MSRPKKMPYKSLLLSNCILSCLYLTSATALANEEVLVTYVPKGATKSQIVAIIKQSFIKRQWTIERSDEDSVTAGLKHRSFDCQVTISLSDGAIVYGESCTQMVTSGPMNNAPRKQSSSVPVIWISNLRADISQSLAAIPDTAPPQNSDKPSDVEERLKVLMKLRDSGLITEQEFAQKRQEILKSL